MNNGVYVKLEDVLALLPMDDTHLRKLLAELPVIIITELEDDTK